MKNKLSHLSLLVIIGSMALPAFSKEGTSTANFLKLGAGSRAAGLGEAYSAAADDATSIYWNPATLTRVEKSAVSLMHATYIESSHFDFLGYAHRLSEKSALGFGIQYFSAGSVDAIDTNNVSAGTINPTDLAASIGYAFSNRAGSFGLAAKFIQSKLVDSASTWGTDVGYVSPWLHDKAALSIVATNVGGKLKFDEDKEELPTLYKTGLAFRITPRCLMTYDFALPKSGDAYHSLGAEVPLAHTEALTLTARAGYNTRTKDVDGSGLSGGFGFEFRRVIVDYSLATFGDLGLSHRFSFGTKF